MIVTYGSLYSNVMYLEKWNDAFYELIGFKVTFGYLFLSV